MQGSHEENIYFKVLAGNLQEIIKYCSLLTNIRWKNGTNQSLVSARRVKPILSFIP